MNDRMMGKLNVITLISSTVTEKAFHNDMLVVKLIKHDETDYSAIESTKNLAEGNHASVFFFCMCSAAFHFSSLNVLSLSCTMIFSQQEV